MSAIKRTSGNECVSRRIMTMRCNGKTSKNSAFFFLSSFFPFFSLSLSLFPLLLWQEKVSCLFKTKLFFFFFFFFFVCFVFFPFTPSLSSSFAWIFLFLTKIYTVRNMYFVCVGLVSLCMPLVCSLSTSLSPPSSHLFGAPILVSSVCVCVCTLVSCRVFLVFLFSGDKNMSSLSLFFVVLSCKGVPCPPFTFFSLFYVEALLFLIVLLCVCCLLLLLLLLLIALAVCFVPHQFFFRLISCSTITLCFCFSLLEYTILYRLIAPLPRTLPLNFLSPCSCSFSFCCTLGLMHHKNAHTLLFSATNWKKKNKSNCFNMRNFAARICRASESIRGRRRPCISEY